MRKEVEEKQEEKEGRKMTHSCPPSHGWPELEARRGLSFKSGS